MNTFGRIFRLTDFGESHGPAMGGVIDGVPAGFRLNTELVQENLNRRKPGNRFTTQRSEDDIVEWLSGISNEGITLGTPIGFIVRNKDKRSADYSHLKHSFRPGHADYTTYVKYGIRDHRGGGRASARQTLCRVVAGAIAEQMLLTMNIRIRAFISGVGPYVMENPYQHFPSESDILDSAVYCPDTDISCRIEDYLKNEIVGHDSVGGRVSLICRGVTPGIGSPVYGRLDARLAEAMIGINAAKGIEFGMGMKSAGVTGICGIDSYTCAKITDNNNLCIRTAENRSGGIDGGISSGEDICFSVAFKPTPSRPYAVNSFTDKGDATIIDAGGRHDPCVAIRAVLVVRAMTAMVLLDEILINRAARW